MNELPLRKLFIYIDGKHIGPTPFSGEIGKQLKSLQKLDIINFEKITFKINFTTKNNCDADYLYKICKCIDAGVVDDTLKNGEPGKMHHARWLTLANNILKLYISTTNPTKNLNIIANYIVRVYAPSYFTIKKNPTISDATTNLFYIIQNSRYIDIQYRYIIDESISNNCFYAHSESVLLSMLKDKEIDIRRKAIKIIIDIRKNNNTNIRTFELPNINFNADYYYEINFNIHIYESRLTYNIEDSTLNNYLNMNFEEITFEYPCHNQAVERFIQDVSQVSQMTTGEQSRDGIILNMIK